MFNLLVIIWSAGAGTPGPRPSLTTPTVMSSSGSWWRPPSPPVSAPTPASTPALTFAPAPWSLLAISIFSLPSRTPRFSIIFCRRWWLWSALRPCFWPGLTTGWAWRFTDWFGFHFNRANFAYLFNGRWRCFFFFSGLRTRFSRFWRSSKTFYLSDRKNISDILAINDSIRIIG